MGNSAPVANRTPGPAPGPTDPRDPAVPADPALGVAGDQVPRGVLVLGMHRSGTSAVAGLLHLLGLASCVPDDLITGMAWNPRGHWESRSLSRLNEHLLGDMGHAWWYPPPVGSSAGPANAEPADRITIPPAEAAAAFDRAHPTEPWFWKDPRNCLTLPYWRRALDRPVAAVIVFRHPLDVATSLEYRNSLSVPFGLALWERYNRLLLEHAGGMPVLLTSYDDLIGDPVGWSVGAAGFLAGLGFEPRTGTEDEVRRFVDPELRHSHRAGEVHAAAVPTGSVTAGASAVLGALQAGAGVHRSFEPPALPVEDPEVEAVLRSRWPDRPPGWNEPPWAVADGPGAGRPPA